MTCQKVVDEYLEQAEQSGLLHHAPVVELLRDLAGEIDRRWPKLAREADVQDFLKGGKVWP